MAVPSSGQLRLYADIGTELGVAQSNVSLGTMSNTAGFPAPDAMSDFYGYSSASAPSVTTNNISNIGETTLTINGNITSDGGATITERGFYFGTNSSLPTNNTKYTVGGTTGYYSNNRTGLSASTTYYCWAFATNSQGTTYGSRVQASTVAAFVPTFADSGTTGYAYLQTTIHTGQAQDITHYFQKLYRNPNTNSYVQYQYASIWNQNVTSTVDVFTWEPNYKPLCTNALNMVISVSNMDYPPNNVSYNMETKITRGGSLSITDRSYVSLLNNPTATIVKNNSTTDFTVQTYNNNQNGESYAQFYLTFNYG